MLTQQGIQTPQHHPVSSPLRRGKRHAQPMMATTNPSTPLPFRLEKDVILPMKDPYMDQILDGTKTYEFRKYRLSPSVERIWFYRTAPHSSITHISEIVPARTRKTAIAVDGNGDGDDISVEDKTEYDAQCKKYKGHGSYAYKIVSVYEIEKALSLSDIKQWHGFKSAPRGVVYLPDSIRQQVDWRRQKRL